MYALKMFQYISKMSERKHFESNSDNGDSSRMRQRETIIGRYWGLRSQKVLTATHAPALVRAVGVSVKGRPANGSQLRNMVGDYWSCFFLNVSYF